MESLTTLGQLLALLEEHLYGAGVLIILLLINKLGPPKG